MENNVFEELRKLNVTGHVEKKNGLNYLSWAWAWDEVMKKYPNAIYEIERFEGKPYLYDPLTGYMVFTRMNIENIEREMWLPVMDAANKAMLDHEYTYKVAKWEWQNGKKVKVGEETKTVEVATMFDINKTIMRCLVKNLAMFGLGLALYSGEDLPEEELTEEQLKEKTEKLIEKAKEYRFAESSKAPNMTILEAYEKNKNYLQWWIDKGKNEELRDMIIVLTGMKPTYIPKNKEEEVEIMSYMQKFKLADDEKKEKIYKKYKVDGDSQLTIDEWREIFKKV